MNNKLFQQDTDKISPLQGRSPISQKEAASTESHRNLLASDSAKKLEQLSQQILSNKQYFSKQPPLNTSSSRINDNSNVNMSLNSIAPSSNIGNPASQPPLTSNIASSMNVATSNFNYISHPDSSAEASLNLSNMTETKELNTESHDVNRLKQVL